MTYKTYAVTTVVTMDNEQLAKHLSWSSHLKGNYQKKQNVLQAPETWTEPNCTKYCETSILAPSAKYPAYIYIYMHLKKLSWLFLAKTKHIGSPSQDSHKKRNRSRAEEADSRHVGKVLGQPKKKEKRRVEWKQNRRQGWEDVKLR